MERSLGFPGWGLLALLCMTHAGCQSDGRKSSESSTGNATATESGLDGSDSAGTDGQGESTSSGGSDDATETETSSDDDGADDGPPKLDTVPSDGSGSAETGTGDACKKVDIIFAIDTSGSMGEEQSALLAAFPDFANAMVAALDTVDSLRVGIVASGPYTGNDPSTCEVQGALVAQTQCLPFADGHRFITDADDIVDKFTCNAALGLGGPGDNTTMQNVIGGISDMQGPGECNDGFLRDDALLVVVIITDEEDDFDNPPCCGYQGSPGDPPDWIDAVTAAKGGIEENVVVISFVQPPEPNTCPPGNLGDLKVWFEANRIIEFTTAFTNGFVHDICDTAGFGTAFETGLGLIESACDSFTPPG